MSGFDPKFQQIHEIFGFYFYFRLNANPLPIPYHPPKPVESRMSNGNMVMIPPSSPRKTAGNKYGSEKTKQQYKNKSKIDITSKLLELNSKNYKCKMKNVKLKVIYMVVMPQFIMHTSKSLHETLQITCICIVCSLKGY